MLNQEPEPGSVIVCHWCPDDQRWEQYPVLTWQGASDDEIHTEGGIVDQLRLTPGRRFCVLPMAILSVNRAQISFSGADPQEQLHILISPNGHGGIIVPVEDPLMVKGLIESLQAVGNALWPGVIKASDGG